MNLPPVWRRVPRSIHLALFVGLLLVPFGRASADVTVGFVEPFTSTLAGWESLAQNTNPGTGGTLGVGDGFVRCARTAPGFLGIRSNSANYNGNWLAAGAKLRFALNDIESNEPLELHVGIGHTTNFWVSNAGLAPPENAWGTFEIAFSDSTQFTQIITGGGGFAQAIQNVDRLLIRHDVAPFDFEPNVIAGQFGLDHVQIIGTGVGVDGPIPGTRQPVWLAPPSPNPSRGAVACAVETSDGEALRFTVLDARGRIVRSATLETAAPGPRLWMWDGLDDAGGHVAAGVYRVRVVGPSGGMSRSIVRID